MGQPDRIPRGPTRRISLGRPGSVYFAAHDNASCRAPIEMRTETPPNPVPRRSQRVAKRIAVSLVVKNQGSETTLLASTANVSAHDLCVQIRRSLQRRRFVYALARRRYTPAGHCGVVRVTQPAAELEFLN